MKKVKTYSKRGRLNRAAGARFELKVRNDLEEKGWIIDKWTNNFDLESKKLVKAKRRFNPYSKVLSIGTGFPDFICFKNNEKNNYEIIGVEVKRNGWLDKSEKEKCKEYIKNKIFSKILIAKEVLINFRNFNIFY
jgi:tRNA G46 methylase TrmB